MSLTKLLKAPIKLFRKEVITFIVIRRYDLGDDCPGEFINLDHHDNIPKALLPTILKHLEQFPLDIPYQVEIPLIAHIFYKTKRSLVVFEDKLRYIAIKPSASISVLRQKVWQILDLPDYCEEIIVLKSNADSVIPLIEMRKGNDPQHPYILEVWLPGKRKQSSTFIQNNLLTIGNGDERIPRGNTGPSTNTICDGNLDADGEIGGNGFSQSTISNETLALNKLRVSENKRPANTFISDFKKWDMSCRMSSTSIFKLNGKKSRDNFADILTRIQNDLNMLGNKLDALLLKVEKKY